MRERLKFNGLVLWRVYGRWQNDDGPLMSAAVAYYLGLSIFPALLLVIAGLGFFFQHTTLGQDAQHQVIQVVSDQGSPNLAKHVQQVLDQVQDRSELGGRLGIIGVLIAAIAGFTQFERAFNHIWNVPISNDHGLLRTLWHTLIERGVAFLMLLCVGVLVVIVFIAGIVVAGIQHTFEDSLGWSYFPGPLLRIIVSILLNTLLFTFLYRFLPPVKIRWNEAVRAAMFAACGWELGRAVLASWVIGTWYTSAYGLVGSFLAVLLWCYYAIAVIFVAAEYLKEIRSLSVHDESPVESSYVGEASIPAMATCPPMCRDDLHPREPEKDILTPDQDDTKSVVPHHE